MLATAFYETGPKRVAWSNCCCCIAACMLLSTLQLLQPTLVSSMTAHMIFVFSIALLRLSKVSCSRQQQIALDSALLKCAGGVSGNHDGKQAQMLT